MNFHHMRLQILLKSVLNAIKASYVTIFHPSQSPFIIKLLTVHFLIVGRSQDRQGQHLVHIQ